jgi:PAS domain S-box-containing protein
LHKPMGRPVKFSFPDVKDIVTILQGTHRVRTMNHVKVISTFCVFMSAALFPQLLVASGDFAAVAGKERFSQSIRIVMDDNYPPYAYRDEQKQLKGIVVDQWILWEKKTGVHAEITGMDWGEAQRRMRVGEFDVIDTIFKNKDREISYDFTKPYARLDVPLFFNADISGISGADDLKGFLVGAKAGDNSIDVLKKHGVTNIALYPSYETLIEAARDGKVKVFTVDRPPALYFLNKMGIQNRFRETAPIYSGEFHRAVQKGRGDLLAIVEKGFSDISAAEYRAIDKKWMGTPISSSPYFRYLEYAASLVAALVIGLLVWLGALNRAVADKTRELTESEKRFRAIFNSVTDAIFIHDVESGAVVDVNIRMCEMYGMTRGEALGASVGVISANVPPYTQEDAWNWLRGAAAGKPQSFEWHARRKDGSLFWVDVNMTRAAIGARDRILVTVREITERKSAEEELRNSEAYNRMLFELSPIGLAVARMDGELVDVNSSFANIIGRTVDDCLNLTYWGITPEKYLLLEQQHLASLNATGIYGPYEKEYLHKDGHLVPVRLQGLLIERKGEKCIWSSVEDITRHKQDEQKIRRLTNLYAALSKCNEAISHCKSEDMLFQQICQVIVNFGGLLMAWVGLTDPTTGLVIIVAKSGQGIGYLEEIQISANHDSPFGKGPTGIAIRNKCQVWSQDFLNDPLTSAWHERAVRFGIRGSASLPLYREGKVVGALTLYASEVDAFDEANRNLLAEMSANISFGLDNLANEAAQKRVGKELRKSEELLRFFFAYAPVALAMFDMGMCYIYASNRWCSDYGLENRDLRGLSHYEAFPEITEQWRVAHRRGLAGEVVREDCDRFDRADGSVQWICWEIRPWYDLEGNIGGIVISTEDITKRKDAEEELRQSEARFRTMADAMPQLAWIAHADGFIYWYNRRWYEYTGMTAEQMEGWGWQEVHAPQVLPTVIERWQESIATGEPFEMVFPLRAVDGKFRQFLTRVQPFKDTQGKVVRWFGTNTDINEIKRVEEALRRSEADLRKAQEIAKLGSWTFDLSGSKLWWSDQTYRVYGVSPVTFAPDVESFVNLILPEDRPAMLAWIDACSAGDKPGELEFRSLLPDGTVHFISGRGELIAGDEERPAYLAGTAMDITERKLAEEKIRSLNEELEERVRERTAQLEAVNKELEAFSYSVSHDLKAPLRGIDGYSQLLEKDYSDRLDDEGRLFIRYVRESTAQMHQLIEDLLNYSRMERRSLQYVGLDLPALVQAVVSERSAEIERAGVQLHLEIPHLQVRVDRDGLAIVMRNLLENAVKFSRNAQPPTVEIGARPEGDKVILWVRDNGIGFDMKFNDRIFEIFQRLQRTEDYPGTGVGLALVRKAMQRMGGRAWAESAPGAGATFFLEIPYDN